MATDLIDTRSVRGRRALRFADAAEVLRDVDALLAAERAGSLQRLGNWTLGQALAHLAAWASYPFDGYPPELRANALVRFFARLLKRRMLSGPLPAGFRIPRAPGGTWGADDVSAEEGAARCRRAFERLDREPPRRPNPVFGPLAHEDWKRLNLAHAELHLSFFRPCSEAPAPTR